MQDPAEDIAWTTLTRPPMRGPGSGKDAWVNFAAKLSSANHGLQDTIDEQSQAIRLLKAEIELLKRQIAERRPNGGRAPLPEATVARIEEEIARGGTDRSIAARFRVSHMSVYRIRERARARDRAAARATGS